jgi:hypothetical protein
MKVQIEKDLKDMKGWTILFEDKDGNLTDGEIGQIKEDIGVIEIDGFWFYFKDIKVVDILK